MNASDDELAPDPTWMQEGAASPVIAIPRAEHAMMVEAERAKGRRVRRLRARAARVETLDGFVDLDGVPLPPGPYRVTDLDLCELNDLDRDPERLYEYLARVTGRDAAFWRKRVEGSKHPSAALVFAVHEDVTRIHSRTFRVEDRNGQRLLTFRGASIQFARIDRVPLPAFGEGVVDAMLTRGLDKIGSVNGHRLLRWEIREGHRRAFAGEPDARALHVDGGFEALCDLLEIQRKCAPDLHAIVLAQAHCVFPLPSRGHGNMLSYSIAPGDRSRRGFVRLVLGDALLPFFTHAVREALGNNTRSAREARRLVPIVDLPPFVGSPCHHGAQATLSMSLVREMRAAATDLVTHGGVQLNMVALAQRSGVPTVLVPRILERWVQDGDDGPAFLKASDADRYTLGDAHEAARAFLEGAGRQSLAGRARKAGDR